MSTSDIIRDQEFYFSFRTFQVEDTLFRVPRHLFPASKIQPIALGTNNNDDFVVLDPQIKKADFVELLRVVFPRKYNAPEVLSPDAWQKVLKLSETLGMSELRKKAASELKDFFMNGDPIAALICAQKNGLNDWVEPCIQKCAKTGRRLGKTEVDQLGITLALEIARAQGRAESNKPKNALPISLLLGTANAEDEWAIPVKTKKKKGKKGV